MTTTRVDTLANAIADFENGHLDYYNLFQTFLGVLPMSNKNIRAAIEKGTDREFRAQRNDENLDGCPNYGLKENGVIGPCYQDDCPWCGRRKN